LLPIMVSDIFTGGGAVYRNVKNPLGDLS